MAKCREIALKEMQGVRDASVVIVYLPGGRGTHVEMGGALFGRDNVVFVCAASQEDLADACVFYHVADGIFVGTLLEISTTLLKRMKEPKDG